MRDKLIDLFYENNVRCDQTIEGLVDDVIWIFKEHDNPELLNN